MIPAGLPVPYERGWSPPLPADREVPAAEDRDLLQRTLDQALAWTEPDAGEETRLIALLKYVPASLRLADASPGARTASAVLASGEAVCDGFCKVFGMLCRQMGLASRDVGLYNIGPATGHNLCEVYAGGAWRLFDPMYAVFFYSRPRYDGAGRILCLHDLMTRPGEWTMIQVLPRPWSGWTEAARRFEPRPADSSYMGFKGYSLPLDYAGWLKGAYPATYRGAMTVFPVAADLGGRDEVVFGPGGDCGGEACRALSCGPGSGSISVGFAFAHTLVIHGGTRYRLVTIGYEFQDLRPDLRLLPLSAMHVLSMTRQERSVRFTVRLVESEGLGLVFAETFGRIAAIRIRGMDIAGRAGLAIPRDGRESRLARAAGC